LRIQSSVDYITGTHESSFWKRQVQNVLPKAVVRGSDGYLRVFYETIGVKFERYEQWIAAGQHVPAGPLVH
jgi:hypothetical protein